MSDSAIAFHIVPGSEEMDRVTLQVPKIPRVCPDGARLEVCVYHEERTYHDSARGHVREPYRVASISVVNEDGKRGAGSGAEYKFGSTLASPSTWSRVEESRGYWRAGSGDGLTGEEVPGGYDYWRVTSSTTYRAEGSWDELPDGARRAFFDVCNAAAGFVADRLPYLWNGADEKRARGAVESAESALAAARSTLADAKKTLRAAERAHVRAEQTHAKKTARAAGESVTS